ncbi:MAG: hypothetical protein JWP03_324, partial [Phycisphaerales bacterium]|nr:hypothetical protein [Phycisphaerales bacterium]
MKREDVKREKDERGSIFSRFTSSRFTLYVSSPLSSMNVAGPSLTNSTFMSAPKLPVATGTPAARTASTKASTHYLA